jgi:hypothetical protein
MKNEEDEAFEDIERRQGGGFPAKRAMAKARIEEDDDIQDYVTANPDMLTIAYQSGYHDGKKAALAGRERNFCERCGKRTADLTVIHTCTPPQQEAIYGMNQDDWKDVVAAISKVRDGRGIYLGCRPADVFQEWFLALGTAKVKEKNG